MFYALLEPKEDIRRLKLYLFTHQTLFLSKVQIGCHTDTLYGLTKLDRNPSIVTQFPFKGATAKASNPWGGLVYIKVRKTILTSCSTTSCMKAYVEFFEIRFTVWLAIFQKSKFAIIAVNYN